MTGERGMLAGVGFWEDIPQALIFAGNGRTFSVKVSKFKIGSLHVYSILDFLHHSNLMSTLSR